MADGGTCEKAGASLQEKALAKLRKRACAGADAGLPGIPSAADFRAATEDDDGYDPYSDYMDELARSAYEEPSAEPWR